MATPTTAIQIEMAQRAFEASLLRPMEAMRNLFFPRLYELIYRRVFLQRPHTDDMMQMCSDLGVDVPDRQRISFDGLRIDLR